MWLIYEENGTMLNLSDNWSDILNLTNCEKDVSISCNRHIMKSSI